MRHIRKLSDILRKMRDSGLQGGDARQGFIKYFNELVHCLIVKYNLVKYLSQQFNYKIYGAQSSLIKKTGIF